MSWIEAILPIDPELEFLRQRLVDAFLVWPTGQGLSVADAVVATALHRFVAGLRSCPGLH
jgi:hypothetical protein